MMEKTILVRYKTSEAQADANATLVRAVYDELRARAPKGFRYATYRLADGASFVHIATVADGAANPLLELPAFKAFSAGIKDRCVEPPVATDVTIVDSYGQVTT
ncbi:MAG: hypothetical protein JWM82_3107 [Myxococcales bacterium]|jgi:hypothetical protein|nr:hypothetical protein [Myxococcales bacterium]